MYVLLFSSSHWQYFWHMSKSIKDWQYVSSANVYFFFLLSLCGHAFKRAYLRVCFFKPSDYNVFLKVSMLIEQVDSKTCPMLTDLLQVLWGSAKPFVPLLTFQTLFMYTKLPSVILHVHKGRRALRNLPLTSWNLEYLLMVIISEY